jgi:putative redox protein
VNVTGERAEDHPKRYTRILIEYVLEGKGITSKDVERAIKLSTTKYCSATASMNAQVETSYRIADKAG